MNRLLLFVFLQISISSSYETSFIRNYLKVQKTHRAVVYSCDQRINWNVLQLSAEFPLNLQRNYWKIDENMFVHDTLIVADSKCVQFQDLLRDANQFNLFRARMRWLILNSDNKTLLDGNLNILTDSQFIVVTPIDQNQLELNLIYKIHKQHKEFLRNYLGIYSIDESRFLELNNFTFAKNRTDLQGNLMKISYILTHNESVDHLEDYRDTHIDTPSKVSYLLLQPTLDQLNVTTQYILRDSWGDFNRTTKRFKDGMLRDLQLEDADLAGTVFYSTLERSDYFLCYSAYVESGLKFIFRAPPLSYVENIVKLPFHTNVWYACYIITIIILFVMYVIVLWEIKTKHYFEEVSDSRNLLNYEELNVEFSDICLLQLGCVSQQGTEIEPKSYSGRIATFTILLALMFLYTSYSANIVALLQSTSDSITTVSDLLESSINLGADDVIYNHHLLSKVQDPIDRELYLKKIAPVGQPGNFYKLNDGIKKIQHEFFAFHACSSSTYYLIKKTFQEHEKCGLTEIDFLRMKTTPCMPRIRNSSYTELLEISAKKIWETGITSRINRRLISKKPPCIGRGSSFMSVGLEDGYFAFVMFGAGIVLAMVLLILETIAKKYEKKMNFLTANWK